jgi:hypothetical protein
MLIIGCDFHTAGGALDFGDIEARREYIIRVRGV